MTLFTIDPDIRVARSMPRDAYTSDAWFEKMREAVFARTWHYVADSDGTAAPRSAVPCTFLAGCLDEPVVLTRDATGSLRALSNVCTHRGNLLVHEAKEGVDGLRCRYHGRRFRLDGGFVSMPEFEGAEGFPSETDDLAQVPLAPFGPLLFASVRPAMPFDALTEPMRASPPDAMRSLVFSPERSRDYEVHANWALYCDNYLEGFHIPFVHPGLNAAVEYDSYETHLHPWGTTQVAHAKLGEDAFDATDPAERVAAYYAFLFPCTMVNLYPWGLSLNVVRPVAVDRTIVSFRTYVRDESRIASGAGARLHDVELEDEGVVEAVQKGVRSRLYKEGRYSPTRETGVHHFHRLLAATLGEATE